MCVSVNKGGLTHFFPTYLVSPSLVFSFLSLVFAFLSLAVCAPAVKSSLEGVCFLKPSPAEWGGVQVAVASYRHHAHVHVALAGEDSCAYV